MTDFLGATDVVLLHADQIDRYGGETGVRDTGLLDSAVAQAQAGFGGSRLHADLFEMAAAYLYHVVQNHPFLDGSKRTRIVAALVLDINGVEIVAPTGCIYELTMGVARGNTRKAEVAEFFRRHAH